MADRFVTCPLCGLEFQPVDTLCEHGCPLRTACGLIRCPSCEYEFPETPRAISWLKRLFGRTEQPVACPPGTRTVRDMSSGERATVAHLAGESSERHNALAVFGLVPGSEIVLLQRYPSYVIEVGETVIALEADVAGSIVVRSGTEAPAAARADTASETAAGGPHRVAPPVAAEPAAER